MNENMEFASDRDSEERAEGPAAARKKRESDQRAGGAFPHGREKGTRADRVGAGGAGDERAGTSATGTAPAAGTAKEGAVPA